MTEEKEHKGVKQNMGGLKILNVLLFLFFWYKTSTVMQSEQKNKSTPLDMDTSST